MSILTDPSPGITLLGLGPGDPDLLTRQAWSLLESIPEIYLRTRHHPVLAGFPSGLRVHSFDHLYEKGDTFEVVYNQIVEKVLELGERSQGVIYAVPGHPYMAEATSPEISRRARERGIPVRVVEGVSFLEPMMTALGLDPFPNTVLVDALELGLAHVPPFPPSAPAIVAQIYSKTVASEVKLTLMSHYPNEHPVHLVHAAGTSQVQVESLPLYKIDRNPNIGLLTSLYVPPLGPEASFEAFQEIIAHLRAPNGCPWDREQTHQTLRPYLLEEAYEVLSAIDAEDPTSMCEELGDLLLQIVLHAQIAGECGEFNMSDVLRGVRAKILRRHPHVFSDLELKDVKGVLQNWERIKAVERAGNGQAEPSCLDGVAQALPALAQAGQYQQRAARVGFGWPEIQGVVKEINEEMAEVRRAVDDEARGSEIGDLLFAVVNLARWFGIDAESALRQANVRFRERFSYIERAAQLKSQPISDLSLDEMEAAWQSAKHKMKRD
ncbi:MAG TPA: nucleoside triphosphate pyrophosphohydrolase [bacterium]|nr:nucleoside triphosphate pyrophosphohydrolase [bacterium]